MPKEKDSVNTSRAEIGRRLREEVLRLGGVSRAESAVKASRATLYNWFDSGLIPATELSALAQIGLDVAYVVTGLRSGEGRHVHRYDADLLDQVVQQIYKAVARANPAPSAAAFAKLCVALYELQLSSGKGLANEVLQAVVPSAAGAATATTREPAQLDAQLREEIDAVVLEALARAGRRVTRAQFDALCRRAYALATETGEPPASEVVTQIVQQFAEP